MFCFPDSMNSWLLADLFSSSMSPSFGSQAIKTGSLTRSAVGLKRLQLVKGNALQIKFFGIASGGQTQKPTPQVSETLCSLDALVAQ